LSCLLINPVRRASKSSSLGKRYMSIPINPKMGPHINIILACCPFR
jgi:hypothetical protein